MKAVFLSSAFVMGWAIAVCWGQPSASAQSLDASVAPLEPAGTLSSGRETIAQVEITPGRATRSGASYLGIGGNIGFGGDTAIGETNVTVYSKIGLTNNISARPSVIIGDGVAILLPVTVDFPITSVADAGEVRVNAAPYVGGGVAISTGGDSVTRALATAGVDVPVADRVTANANVNVAFFDETEVSLRLGVGYNF
jgi:hypothetical protein